MNNSKMIKKVQYPLMLITIAILAFSTISMVTSETTTKEKAHIEGMSAWDYSGLGEIKMFAGTFAPRGWAFCNGQLLSVANNSALFSIIGTTYGGDGRSTFALPDMRGRVAIHSGDSAGPGLTTRPLGQKSGTENNILSQGQLPAHSHSTTLEGDMKIKIADHSTNNTELANNSIFAMSNLEIFSTRQANALTASSIDYSDASVKVGVTGASQAVNNMQPYLAVNYIICTQGTYPSRD